MDPEYTVYLFVGVIAVILFGLAAISARRPGKLDPVTGELVMTYSLPLRVVGVGLGLLVPALLIVVLLAVPLKNEQEALGLGIGGTVFALLGGFLLLETLRFRIIVSEAGIRSHSPWRPVRFLPWGEVRSVTSHSPTRYFVFRGRGCNVRVPQWVTGLELLVAAARRHLPPEVAAEADDLFFAEGFRSTKGP
jgi:hypothetical protein